MFTDPWLSPAVEHARHVLISHADSASPFDSLLGGFALAELIAAKVVDRARVTWAGRASGETRSTTAMGADASGRMADAARRGWRTLTHRPADPEGVAPVAARTPASRSWRSRSSTRRRSSASRRSRSLGSPRWREHRGRAVRRCSTPPCRTTSSRCVAGYIDGPSGDLRLRADPGGDRRRWRRCPAGRGRPSTSTRRTASRSPACPAGVRAANGELRSARAGCPSGPRTSSSSRWAGGRGRRSSSPRTPGPGYSDIALVANHEFALDLIDDDRGAGPRPAAVPSRVRGGTVRAVDRAARPGRGRRRRDDRSTDGAGGGQAARMGHVVRPSGRGGHRQRDRTSTSACGKATATCCRAGKAPRGWSTRGESFMAGILQALPALVAIAAPTLRRATCDCSRITGRARCGVGASRTGRRRCGSSPG